MTTSNQAAPRLLVPMELNTLVSGANAAQTTWAALTPQYDFIALQYITLGDKLLPPTFTQAVPPGAGVHLHWALPDGLTHGRQGQASAVAVLDEAGRVQRLDLIVGGSGYDSPPAVSFDGGGGTGAAATATVHDGRVTGFQITSGGTGYLAPPAVLVGSSARIEYPVVPDRWFVLRLQVDDARRKVTSRSWTVESNALQTTTAHTVLGYLSQDAEPLLRSLETQKDRSEDLARALAEIGIVLSPEWTLRREEAAQAWHLLSSSGAHFIISRRGERFAVSVDRSITWPTLTNEQTPFLYLGRALDNSKTATPPDGGYLHGLTSIGPGNPQFSAFYPNCRSVFGFHDDLDDLAGEAQLTYLVAGYYSDPADDPLYGCTTEALWVERMQQLDWCLAQDPGGFPPATVCGDKASHEDAEPTYPVSIVCHAMVEDVHWKGPNADYSSAVPTQQPVLALGNSSTEALSAMMASMVPAVPGEFGIEEILEAFEYDLLDRLQEPDGTFKLEAALHRSAFGSHSSGIEWQVRSRHVDGGADGNDVFDSTVSQLLAETNALQETLDRAAEDLKSLQWQTYSAWYKKMLIDLSPYGPGRFASGESALNGFRETPGHIMQHHWQIPAELRREPEENSFPVTSQQAIEVLQQLEAQIAAKKTALASLQTTLDAKIQALGQAVATRMPAYELKSTSPPPYWSANDPAVLLAGDGLSRAFQRGESTLLADGERLPCRLSSQTITGLTVAPADYSAQTVTDAQLKTFYGTFSPGTAIPQEIEALFVETLLLTSTMDTLLAVAAYALAGVANPTQPQLAALATTIATIQTAPWNAVLYRDKRSLLPGLSTQSIAAAVGLVGTVPYQISVRRWTQPWIPLLLQWSAGWFPSYKKVDDIVFCNPLDPNCKAEWIFDEVDYQWNTDCVPTGDPASNSVHSGTTLLSPHTPLILKDRLLKYVKEHPDSPYKEALTEVANALGTVNILAQNLGGLGRALTQQLETLQLPVIDLFDSEVGDKVEAAIDGNNNVAPQPEGKYNPVRGGHFQLNRMWVVDGFGQVKKVVDPDLTYDPILAHTLSTPGAQYASLAQLAARVTQSSRLNFQWLSAKEDTTPTNSDPATSPLCGWILPNYFDQSIDVYEADGAAAGSLQMLAGGLGEGGFGVRWIKAPGLDTPVGAPPTLANPHLQQFVTALLDYGAHSRDALRALMQVMEVTASSVAATGGRTHLSEPAVLFGRPLALVRASAQWLLEGLPAFDQSWAALKTLYETGKFETQGFTKVKLPVRIGDIRQSDGMVGYFVGTPEKTDYDTIYPSLLQAPSEASDYTVFGKLLDLTCDPAAPAVMLSMLIDPRIPFNILIDALPSQSIELPPSHIQQALKAMDIFFRVGPIVNDKSGLSLPLTSELHGHWSWVYQPDVVTWKEDATVQVANAEAELPPTPRHIHEGWLKLSDALGDVALRSARKEKKKPHSETEGF